MAMINKRSDGVWECPKERRRLHLKMDPLGFSPTSGAPSTSLAFLWLEQDRLEKVRYMGPDPHSSQTE